MTISLDGLTPRMTPGGTNSTSALNFIEIRMRRSHRPPEMMNQAEEYILTTGLKQAKCALHIANLWERVPGDLVGRLQKKFWIHGLFPVAIFLKSVQERERRSRAVGLLRLRNKPLPNCNIKSTLLVRKDPVERAMLTACLRKW